MESWVTPPDTPLLQHSTIPSLTDAAEPFTQSATKPGRVNSVRVKVPAKRAQNPLRGFVVVRFTRRLSKLQKKRCSGAVLLDFSQATVVQGELASAPIEVAAVRIFQTRQDKFCQFPRPLEMFRITAREISLNKPVSHRRLID